jgi:hypothetical protein
MRDALRVDEATLLLNLHHIVPSKATPAMLKVASEWPHEYYAPSAMDRAEEVPHPETVVLMDTSGASTANPTPLYGAALPMLLGLGVVGYGLYTVSESMGKSAAVGPASDVGTDATGHPITRALGRLITRLNPREASYAATDDMLAHAQRVANDRTLLGLEGVGVGNRMGLRSPMYQTRGLPLNPADLHRASDFLVEPGSQVDVSAIDPYFLPRAA